MSSGEIQHSLYHGLFLAFQLLHPQLNNYAQFMSTLILNDATRRPPFRAEKSVHIFHFAHIADLSLQTSYGSNLLTMLASM